MSLVGFKADFDERATPPELFGVFTEAARLCAAGWCQGAMARGRTNRPCYINSDRAVSFCVEGAIIKAARDSGQFGEQWFVWKVKKQAHLPDYLPLTAWNDMKGRTQADVVGILSTLARS